MSTATPTPPPVPARRFQWAALWSAGQFVIALVLTLGVLAYLVLTPPSRSDPAGDRPASSVEPVTSAGPGLLRVAPASPLSGKLQIVTLQPVRLSDPVLTVTGTVVASLHLGADREAAALPALMAASGGPVAATWGSDYWQFNAPEVLTAFTDWQRAKADIAFAQRQLVEVRELAAARLVAQQEVVDRAEKDFKVGNGTREKWEIARNDLKQTEITGRKDVHDAEVTLAKARRDEAALARQLQQAGLDPELLTSVISDVDIVMADVPEGFLGRVKVGQGCEARFFGIPNQVFRGQVRSIAPVVTRDRRSLRVLFTITDLNDQLRPGMFAEIGLGTDPRDALLAPAEGVIHVGRSDYLLVATDEPGVWRVTAVQVGEVRAGRVEVLNWLKPGEEPPATGTAVPKVGDRVIGQGAILLKPAIVRAVQPGAGNGGRP
jgi:hypothetical protein